METVYDAMKRLKPKRMVVTECGHAYRATIIEGPYWAGIKTGQTPVPSFHYVEWVAEYCDSSWHREIDGLGYNAPFVPASAFREEPR